MSSRWVKYILRSRSPLRLVHLEQICDYICPGRKACCYTLLESLHRLWPILHPMIEGLFSEHLCRDPNTLFDVFLCDVTMCKLVHGNDVAAKEELHRQLRSYFCMSIRLHPRTIAVHCFEFEEVGLRICGTWRNFRFLFF